MKAFWILFAIFISIPVAAEDWNQWRGPNRTGIFTGFAVPDSLPEKLTQVWKVEVGVGHSSPVISGKTVFLITRVTEDEVVAAYDLETGKLIWKDSYSAPYTMNPAAIPHGKGPKSTPLIAQGKLFTFGISGILSAYDAGKGKLLWRNDFTKEFPVTWHDAFPQRTILLSGCANRNNCMDKYWSGRRKCGDCQFRRSPLHSKQQR
jgi:outer membrane protein assembly factor BamB